MSKQNTLFSYFNKSPAPSLKVNGESKTTPANKSPKQNTPISVKNKTPSSSKSKVRENGTPAQKPSKLENKPKGCRKRIIEPEDSDCENGLESDDEVSPRKKISKDYPIDSEDSGDEYVPGKQEEESSESEGMEEGESEEEPATEEEEESQKNRKRKRMEKTSGRPHKKVALTPVAKKNNSKVSTPLNSSFSTPNKAGETGQETVVGEDGGNWSFLKYDFLKPEKIRDSKRRLPSDPLYDPRTLYVPDDFLKNQTPAMRQWWEMKSKHFDCILFFKVGKFYEFYHMDAVTGVKELSLTFMRGEYAHCGFPEIAYARFASTLVDKGYKVARVEQTETPEMMTERCKKLSRPTKFDRVVGREICRVTTKGTRIFSVVDGESKESESKYLLAVAEKEGNNGIPIYGVSFIDTSIGVFHIGQFMDDRHSSRLRTLIAKYPPSQVLLERNHVSKQTQVVLNTSLFGAIKDHLASETEFWSSSKTLTKLAEGRYFTNDEFPEVLKTFSGEGESLRLTATEDSELGIRALGAVVWYLKSCLIEHQLLSMEQFEIYVPIDVEAPSNSVKEIESDITTRHMVLDAVTLKNLNVIESNSGSQEGTLLQKLDHCCTPFGKRLLRQWICNPLTNIKSITTRQKAVSVLRDHPEVMREIRPLLAKVPDLERLLSRVHAESSSGLPESHPENKAIFFEEKTYSKRKIVEFISILNGFQKLQEVALLIQESGVGNESEILSQCTHFSTNDTPGKFPDLSENLEFFKKAFDHEEAEKEGRIIPSSGVDEEYDKTMEELNDIEGDLKKYLKTQCEHFGCKVTYVGTDKKRYQLEVPEGACRKAGSDYELQGQRKGFRRYSTVETKELLERLQAAEEVKLNLLKNLRKRIFSKFYERYEAWSAAVQCVSVLDVLLSFAEYACSVDSETCVPVFKSAKNIKAFVDIKNGKYPCFTGEDTFIPNDTLIGQPSSLILLTGPNMGGKSTLMRQLGLLVIMAQIGCYVPAQSMELTVVDRIFTRIGANDDIMAGESTFYLELCETSAILSHSSKHSLVLIDELGRGTSTYDGTAIASSVLKQLCRMESRTIFSTHYHSLVEDFKDNNQITLAHMACMAETEEDSEEGTQETVTFLYKLAPGPCPKSYGFNAARLAGVPAHITKLGSSRAKQLEVEANNRKSFRSLFTSTNISEIRDIIASL